MKSTLTHSLALVMAVALVTGLGPHAASATPAQVGSATETDSAQTLPFKGTLEGRHVSRTPLSPPLVFDRFETEGHATQIGRFGLVIESTVDFGSRPVTGAGTYVFVAANGDRLVADQTGSSTLVRPGTVLITEHATIDPARSTGRFAGAEGMFSVERLADAATGVGGLTTGTFQGVISLPAPSPS